MTNDEQNRNNNHDHARSDGRIRPVDSTASCTCSLHVDLLLVLRTSRSTTGTCTRVHPLKYPKCSLCSMHEDDERIYSLGIGIKIPPMKEIWHQIHGLTDWPNSFTRATFNMLLPRSIQCTIGPRHRPCVLSLSIHIIHVFMMQKTTLQRS